MKEKIQSVEPKVADLVNGWLKSYNLDYKLEQESLNQEIDNALNEYYSKNGGNGGNRPDVKLLMQDKNLKYYPVLIEYKGYKDRLVKLDSNNRVENKNNRGEALYKNINSYAVNGAIHYANAVLHYTNYTDIIAIGVTGFKNNKGELQHLIGVYYVSKNNFGLGQKIDEYEDLSFLRKENFNSFVDKINSLLLTPKEIDSLKRKRENEIDLSLVKLNNDIYQNEKGLGESDRVYLVVATIISTIGIPGKVAPLEKNDLKSLDEKGNRDGDILIRKIKAFFNEKQLPVEKKDLIIRTLQNTLITDNINKVNNGETQLKRVFTKIVDDLGIYYKIGLTTDFTGKLFNEMYSWLGFSQDKLNDVVLTPPYIAKLLVRLARVNKDSYVWDFATGSAGLLVAAMNEMIADARATIKSPDELQNKIIAIKANQLLGIEVLPSVYMLAILNMILMGDGSSNILNKNSLSDFNGQYGNENDIKIFPADAFVLNPPYSAEGKGMIFVERALSLMNRGYAAVIVMYSAGNGQAIEYNKKILKHSTLLASIKMPNDIFVGKSAVQTYIYVFRVGEKHKNDNIVKFIDFSNDGYLRSGNKKANKKLKDIDNAIERYNELVNLVLFDKSKLNYFKDYYKEGKINIDSGMDWNQTAKKEKRINLNNYRKTITDYIEWEVANVLVDNQSNIINSIKMPKKIKKFAIGKLFKVSRALSMYVDDKLSFTYVDKNDVNAVPLVQQMEHSNGITAYIDRTKLPKRFINKIEKAGQISINPDEKFSYYQEKEFIGNSVVIVDTSSLTKNQALYIVSEIQRLRNDSDYNDKFSKGEVEKAMISLPVDDSGSIDYNYMESFVEKVIVENKRVLNEYSK